MGKEKEIDLSKSDDSDLTSAEESEDTSKEVPDETDDAAGKGSAASGSGKGNDTPLADNSNRADETVRGNSPAEIKQKVEPLPGGDSLAQNKKNESEKTTTPKAAEGPKTQNNTNRLSSVRKIVSFGLIILIVAGIFIYYQPSLIGLTKEKPPIAPPPVEAVKAVAHVPQPVVAPSPPSKHELCAAKIEEAVRLRNELLEKKTEIYELNLYYRNGIAELETEIYQEIRNKGFDSFKEAMDNKRLELNLRTIQRRRAYIAELAKPTEWLTNGSEELLFLVRKTRLQLQLTDIAGGINLDQLMSHINAAIRKYRPRPEKLAIDPIESEMQPLEKIWEQVSNKKGKKKRLSLSPKNKLINAQVCSGNFARIAELTSITPAAARCLSKMQGSGLFLNGLTTLSPDAAKELFQWQGNWICLNGVKHLSPAAAQYLFQWNGNWISLNSLNEFPAELAIYLLKWEGQQLELMGLKFDKNDKNQKTLKYLTLWETTGGKLYVTDTIRQEMESLM